MLERGAGSSLSFTLYDVISHLIPGALLLLIVYFTENFEKQIPAEILTVLIIAGSFIAGQILFALGNFLYNQHYHPRDYKKGTIAYFIVNTLHLVVKIIVRQNYDYYGLDIKDDLSKLIDKKLNLKNINNRGRFQLCDALVAQSNFSEREILLAKQGFYKSTTALVVVTIPYLVYRGGLGLPFLFWTILFTVLLRLLLYVHTYYGEIRKVQVYALAYLKLKQM